MTAASGPSEDMSALARKRRRDILLFQRSSSSESSCSESSTTNEGVVLPPKKRNIEPDVIPSTSIPKGTDKKVKTQVRYDPTTPMSKEEAAAWRKEARRVRNRESAAASRRKTRDRIEVLENEVQLWKNKYFAALETLVSIEAADSNSSMVKDDTKTLALLNAVAMERSALNTQNAVVSPCYSPQPSPGQSALKTNHLD